MSLLKRSFSLFLVLSLTACANAKDNKVASLLHSGAFVLYTFPYTPIKILTGPLLGEPRVATWMNIEKNKSYVVLKLNTSANLYEVNDDYTPKDSCLTGYGATIISGQSGYAIYEASPGLWAFSRDKERPSFFKIESHQVVYLGNEEDKFADASEPPADLLAQLDKYKIARHRLTGAQFFTPPNYQFQQRMCFP